MRSSLFVLTLLTAACTGQMGDFVAPYEALPEETVDNAAEESSPAEGAPREETPSDEFVVDTSATGLFVPAGVAQHSVTGRVFSPEGVASLVVAGESVTVDASGQFDTLVPVTSGLQLVEIEARDNSSPQRSRLGNLSLISADYLPEGQVNPTAALLVLSDEVVSSMAESMQEMVAGIDVATEILARETLSDDEQCTTHPTAATQGTPTLSLSVSEAGELWMEVLVPSLHIEFAGTCSMLVSTADVTGSMDTNVLIRTQLDGPLSESCLAGLESSPPAIELQDFDLQLTGGGPLTGWLVSMMAERSEADTAEQLRTEFAGEAETLLAAELEGITIFESNETMELLGVAMDSSLCVTGLVNEEGILRAYVGARVTGPGGLEAPGAPMVSGDVPPPAPDTLWLDANLVGQLLFSAWRAGGLESEGIAEVDMALLAMLNRDLEDLFPTSPPISVSMSGNLPPVVRAIEVEEGEADGDLLLEIGGMDLLLEVDGQLLFRVGSQLELTLELVPEGSGLRPVVVNVESVAYVLEEPLVDVDDAALAEAVRLQIGMVADGLLGDDTVIALPEVGGSMSPTDAVPVPGGRFIQVSL